MFNELIDNQLQDYCDKHTSIDNGVLYQLHRETHLKTAYPRMMCTPAQGVFLQFISSMLKPQRILEIGTYTGYATICLSTGLAQNGELITIEKDVEKEDIIRKYLHLAGIEQKVQLIFGDAMDIIPTLSGQWDLIFMDADKTNYIHYYNMLKNQLSENSIMLIDNVLWSGKVFDDTLKCDKETNIISQFNDMIQSDLEVDNIILPIRDGVMMVRKKNVREYENFTNLQ
ncbi:MAG: O-methyltransferase [Bacteroidales bacterium]|jgi:predicted O-methyltransferase YrrM|nr:O-methyltransferase [Bacteroidales bacterium]